MIVRGDGVLRYWVSIFLTCSDRKCLPRLEGGGGDMALDEFFMGRINGIERMTLECRAHEAIPRPILNLTVQLSCRFNAGVIHLYGKGWVDQGRVICLPPPTNNLRRIANTTDRHEETLLLEEG